MLATWRLFVMAPAFHIEGRVLKLCLAGDGCDTAKALVRLVGELVAVVPKVVEPRRSDG